MALAGCSNSTAPATQSGIELCVTTTPPTGVQVSAHRGGAAYAPENTLVAFQNAVRLGVDELEMDTQLTSDGQLAVLHDATLDRTTDCSGTLSSMTLAQVQACDAGYWFTPGQGVTAPDANAAHPLRGRGVKVPALADLLGWYQALPCTGKPHLSIEIKNIPGEANFDPVGDKTAKVLVPLLAQFGLESQITIQSFWPLTLNQVKQLNPKLATQFLTSSSTGQTALANLTYTVAGGHDISAPNFDSADFNAALVQAAHGVGKRVYPYTPDAQADQTAVAALGVDGIITNYPGCLLQVLHRNAPARMTPEGVPDTPACPAGASTPPPVTGDRPSAETCAALRPSRWSAASGHADSHAKLRVVGIQYKQDVRHVVSYDSYRTKMRCLMEDHAVPLMQPGLPMLVVFNEDIGLMTVATGARGTLVRQQAATPLRGPAGDAAPAGVALALGELNALYAPQVAAYQALYGPIDPRKQLFVAATDTFVRAFSQTFSDIARDYGVYVVASNNMPDYKASASAADLLLFADPELSTATEAYVATSAHVANSTFLWGPRDLHPDAPRGATNLLFKNEKVPLTDIEKTLIALDEGPAAGDAAKANAAGFEVAGFRLGFATSLPAFAWGYDFGQRPAGLAPCADVHISYMPCMDALGVEVVVQAEANPGRWASVQAGGWQPLEWMNSTWRTVTEPSVRFRYNITPMLTGNLLDLPFDGQSAITGRGAVNAPLHYIGNTEFVSGTDLEPYRTFVGDKLEFLALAPWVTPDAPRAALLATGAALSPGSNDPLENDYLETAVWADLVK